MSTSPEAPREASFFTTIRQWGITRGPNGVVGGVVEGVGERIGMARVPARIIVVVLAIVLTSLTALAYAAAWALLPDREGRIIIQDFGRGVTNVGALIGIGFLTLVGFGAMGDGFLTPWDLERIPNNAFIGPVAVFFAVIIPLGVIGSIVWLIVYLARKNGNAGNAAASATPAHATPPKTAQTADAGNANAASSRGRANPAATAAAPTAAAPTAAAPTPVRAPAPPRPRVPGPGRAAYLAALAWAFLTTAGILYADRVGELAVNSAFAWFVIYALGLGVLVMVVGLAGRKMGFLGFVATSMAAILILTMAASSDLRHEFADNRSWFSVELGDDGDLDGFTVFGEEVVVDMRERFSNYDSVHHWGFCRTEPDGDRYTGDFDSTIAATPRNSDVTLHLDARRTEVLLEAGTSFRVEGGPADDSVILLEEQQIECTAFGHEGTLIEAVNTNAPVVTLDLTGHHSGVQIVVIKETA